MHRLFLLGTFQMLLVCCQGGNNKNNRSFRQGGWAAFISRGRIHLHGRQQRQHVKLTGHIMKLPESVYVTVKTFTWSISVVFYVSDLMSAAEISVALSRQLINQLIILLLAIKTPASQVSLLLFINAQTNKFNFLSLDYPEAQAGNLFMQFKCKQALFKDCLSV